MRPKASWAIDSQPIRARGIVKYPISSHAATPRLASSFATLFNIIKTALLVSLLSDKLVKTQVRCTDLIPTVAAISSHPHIRSTGQRGARVTMRDHNAHRVADTQRSHGNRDTPTGTKPVVNVKGTLLVRLKGKQSS